MLSEFQQVAILFNSLFTSQSSELRCNYGIFIIVILKKSFQTFFGDGDICLW